MGRRPLISEKLIQVAASAAASGLTDDDVAALMGVCEGTFYGWMKRGREAAEGDEAEALYVQFFNRVTQARAEARQTCLDEIKRAGREDWRAHDAWLQRTAPKYAKRVTEVSGPEGGPIQSESVVTFEALDAALDEGDDEPEADELA